MSKAEDKLEQEFITVIQDAMQVAADVFQESATASPELVFQVFDRLPSHEEDDYDDALEEVSSNLKRSRAVAIKLFGIPVAASAVLEVYDRIYGSELQDDDEG